MNGKVLRWADPKTAGAYRALAIAWAERTAADLIGSGSPKRKSHGHLAQSWFRMGFDRLRNLLSAGRNDALNAWRRLGKPGRKRANLEGVV